MRAAAVAMTCVALLAACKPTPCSDGTEPAEGTCTCADGEQVKQDECDLCAGTPIEQSLGQLGETSTQGKTSNVCKASYTFETTENGAVELALSDTSTTVTATIRQGLEGPALGQVTTAADSSANVEVNLAKGSYVVTLEAGAASKFELDLQLNPYETETPEGEPSDDPDEAFSLAELTSVQTFGGFVGAADTADFYSFELAENAAVTYAVQDVSGSVQARLYRDEGLFNADKYLDGIDTTSELTHSINLEKGVYLVRLTAPAQTSLYSLSAEAEPYEPYEPAHDPGDEDDPYDLNVLDSLVDELGGYVGPTDAEDFYAFELESDNAVTFAIENVLGHVTFQLYEQSSIFSQNDHIQILDGAGDTVSEPVSLTAGEYLVRITPQNPAVGSLYELTFSPGD